MKRKLLKLKIMVNRYNPYIYLLGFISLNGVVLTNTLTEIDLFPLVVLVSIAFLGFIIDDGIKNG